MAMAAVGVPRHCQSACGLTATGREERGQRLRQRRAFRGIFWVVALQCPHDGVVGVSATGRKGGGGGGHATEFWGARHPRGGGGAKEWKLVCRSDVWVVSVGH